MFEEIKIVYEDDEVLVIDKPAGLVVTSEGVKKQATVEDWLKLRDVKFGQVERCGIVHRLDKGTSGLMVIAKTQKSANNLKKQFKNREVKKTYWALIGGDVVSEGEIKAPIKRSPYVFGRWKVDPGGKEAWTMFRTLGKYLRNGKKYSMVEIDLKTGRTHQVRVHFAYLRWPLVGDKTYGGENISLDRPFLQAKRLGFWHPYSKEWMRFEVEMAADLVAELKSYERI